MPLYRPLTELELDRVSAGIALAGRLLGSEAPPGAAELQALYDLLLQEETVEGAAVEALGYAFGNLFLEYDWLHWAMMLDDEFGDEVAIVVRDRELGCSPLSMIRNRIQDGEPWDLADLIIATVFRLRQLGQEANSA
jgi:hypothetical protein